MPFSVVTSFDHALNVKYQDKRKPPTSVLPHMPLERQQVKTIPREIIWQSTKVWEACHATEILTKVPKCGQHAMLLKNCSGARLRSERGRRNCTSTTQDTPVPTGWHYFSTSIFSLLTLKYLRGRSDDKLNPGNRLQQRWDPELECSRLQRRTFQEILRSSTFDAQVSSEDVELSVGVSLGLNSPTVAMSSLQATLSDRGWHCWPPSGAFLTTLK